MISDQTRNLKVEHQDEHKEKVNQSFGVHFCPFNSDRVSMKIDIILGYLCRIRKSFDFCLLGDLSSERKDANAGQCLLTFYKILIKIMAILICYRLLKCCNL